MSEVKKIVVCGHRNPDTDSIMSALAHTYLLNQTDHEAEALALGSPTEETQYALDYFGVEAPRVIETLEEAPGTRISLVDHNEAQQSIPNRDDYTIISVIDHHRIANFTTAEPLYYRAEVVGCTCTILYGLFCERGVEIPKHIAGLMLSAIISDTLLMKSPTCTPRDVAAIEALAPMAGVDVQTYGLDLLKAGTNLAAKTEAQLLNADAKNFPMGDKSVRIGQVNTVDLQEVLDRQEALEALMQADIEQDGLDLFVLLVTDILNSDSIALAKGNGIDKLEQAFSAIEAGGYVQLPGVVSRKKQVVPQLTAVYEQ